MNFLSEKELNPLLENMTQRFEPLFQEKHKELKHFLNQRIEPLFSDMTHRIELFFTTTQKNVTFNKSMFQRIEHFLYDSMNWTPFLMWHKELNPPFLHNSKTWAFLTWLKQLVLFLFGSSFSFLRWNWTIEAVAGQAWQCTTVYL